VGGSDESSMQIKSKEFFFKFFYIIDNYCEEQTKSRWKSRVIKYWDANRPMNRAIFSQIDAMDFVSIPVPRMNG
jgi:hypothetical protein